MIVLGQVPLEKISPLPKHSTSLVKYFLECYFLTFIVFNNTRAAHILSRHTGKIEQFSAHKKFPATMYLLRSTDQWRKNALCYQLERDFVEKLSSYDEIFQRRRNAGCFNLIGHQRKTFFACSNPAGQHMGADKVKTKDILPSLWHIVIMSLNTPVVNVKRKVFGTQ